jgi:hypothetical protein
MNGVKHSHHHGPAFSSVWDKLGIVASGLCLVDCVVLPVVSTILVSFSSALGWTENLHWYLMPVIGVTAGIAFYHSWQAHRSYRIVYLAAVGFLLLLAGAVSETWLRSGAGTVMSIAGSVALMLAHGMNLRQHLRGGVCNIDHGKGGRNLFGRAGGRLDAILDSGHSQASVPQVVHLDAILGSARPPASMPHAHAAQVP